MRKYNRKSKTKQFFFNENKQRLTFFGFEEVRFVLPFGLFISVFPLFDVRGERDVRFLGVVLRVGRRHPGRSGARYPRGRAARARVERDGTPRALTLIVARRDRKHIITVPFNHFCIRFLSHARVEHSHRPVLLYVPSRTRVPINRLVCRSPECKFANKSLCSRKG